MSAEATHGSRDVRDLSEPIREKTFTVDFLYDGRRLDKFLRNHLRWRSRTKLQEKIRKGDVLVDGRPSKPGRLLREGETVTVKLDVPEIDLDTIPLETLYEDEHLIVLNKPAGYMVHPTGRHVFGTLLNVVHKRMKEAGEIAAGRVPLPCHRLDQFTSGTLLIAKTKDARRKLQEEFESGRVEKRYAALVEGVMECEEARLDYPIAPQVGAKRLTMEVVPHGHPSLTLVRVVERFRGGFTLVECDLKTGRTHQIRIHLAHFGHPVVCDEIYGVRTVLKRGDLGEPPAGETLLSRQALHARVLGFTHPESGERVVVEAPLPPDMKAVVEALRLADRRRRT